MSHFFTEEQRVSQPWIFILLLGIVGLWLWQVIQQVIMGIPFGTNPAPNVVILIMGIVPLGAIFLVISLRLQTRVDKEGIHYRMYPLHRRFREIRTGEIAKWEVKKYHPIRDYGGWGIRTGFYKKGSAFNIAGDMGAYFELKDGKKILIGTQRPEEMRSALGKMMQGA